MGNVCNTPRYPRKRIINHTGDTVSLYIPLPLSFEESLAQVKSVVYSSRLIPRELLSIIIDYSHQHPYYSINKRIRAPRFPTHEYGLMTEENYIITQELELRNEMFIISRLHGDISFNIKYSIPKESFVKCGYFIEVYINGCMVACDECIINDNGDNYILWSPDTSLPIPIICFRRDEVIVRVIDEFGNYHSSGVLTTDYFITRHYMPDIVTLTTSDLITAFHIRIKNYNAAHDDYSKFKGLEIFPGIRVIKCDDNYIIPVAINYR